MAHHTSDEEDVGAADATFVASMIPHHELGIHLLNIGARLADDVRVRRLIFEMNNYHADDHARLSRWAFEWDVRPVDDFPGEIDEKRLRALSELSGSDFDRQWLRVMIDHHLGAVKLAHDTIAVSNHEEVTDLAQRIATMQQRELATMTRLLSEMSVK